MRFFEVYSKLQCLRKKPAIFSSTQVSLNCNIKLVWTQDCHVKVMLLLGKVKESFVLVPCFSNMPHLFLSSLGPWHQTLEVPETKLGPLKYFQKPFDSLTEMKKHRY